MSRPTLPTHACSDCEKKIRLPAAKTREEREVDIQYHKREYKGLCRQCFKRRVAALMGEPVPE